MPSLVRQRGYALASCGLGESYFSAEGDEDVSKADMAPALSWRGDPKLTFSDWKIVVSTSQFDSRTYHVHKSILSVGPRCSKYFANLFLEQGQHYNQSQTTRIELDEQDADSFPLFLDFLYNIKPDVAASDDDSLSLVVGDDFTTSNAVSLRHLARVFDCEGLMLAVNKFIQKDLSLKTGPLYLSQAYIYQDERLIESAKRLCIENFAHLEARTITRLPLPLFRAIVSAVIERSKSSVELNNREAETSLSHQLSDVVCQYFEKHPDALTVDLLLEFTDESIMPRIASEPAIGFTALARELNPRDVPPNTDKWRGLVTLCQRCAQAVVSEYGWKEFNVRSALDEYLHGPCAHDGSKMDSLLFATSFAAALERAQSDYKNINKGSSGFRKQAYDLQMENSALQATNRSLKDDLDRHKLVLADTREELLLLKQQIKDLRRRQRESLEHLS